MAVNNLNTGVGIQPTIVDAKGDLIAATANDAVNRLAVGTNGHVLVADSGETTGLKWNDPGSVGGLVHIKTVDTGGAVSSFNVTDCFSATFYNYRITIDVIGGGATERDLNVRYLVGSTPNATANYRTQLSGSTGATTFAVRTTGATSHRVGRCSNVTKFAQIVDVFFPFQTNRTQIISRILGAPSGNIENIFHSSAFDLTTSFDGIQFIPSGETINGKISVFGYATQ